MLSVLKRLSLGLLLIALTAGILLVADLEHRTGGSRAAQRVAVLQHADTPVLDEGVRGLVDGLAARGFRDGERLVLQRFNAQGDMAMAEVEDDGRPFNPLEAPPPDLDRPIEERPVGGLGLHIVRTVMDTVAYRRQGSHNVLTVTKRVG
jgi:hypothetical protein